MVSYSDRIGKAGLKPMIRKLLTQANINYVVVAVAQKIPGNEHWASRLPVVGRHPTLDLADGHRVMLTDSARCQIAKEVFWSKGRLEKVADRIALDCAIKLSSPGGLFIDIGSYTGLFALAVARVQAETKVFAYEIVPENLLAIWRNIFANNLVGRIEPRLVGLGAAEGAITIPQSFGPGILASSVALDATEADGIKIPVSTLDIEHPTFTGKAVLKIDVETFEWPVLCGAREFIGRNRPDMICEVLRRAPNINEISAFLQERKYNTYHITQAGLKSSMTIAPNVAERDWLFTVRSRDELRAMNLPVT